MTEKLGKFVIVRTYSAGVFAGYLERQMYGFSVR